MEPLGTVTRVYWLSLPVVESVIGWLTDWPMWIKPNEAELEVTIRFPTTVPVTKTTIGFWAAPRPGPALPARAGSIVAGVCTITDPWYGPIAFVKLTATLPEGGMAPGPFPLGVAVTPPLVDTVKPVWLVPLERLIATLS